MAKFKVEVDAETCIGCGACTASCPDSFTLKDTDKGRKAKATKPDVDELSCENEAAGICPVNAIHITDTVDNKKII
jgi:ferredoxin